MQTKMFNTVLALVLAVGVASASMAADWPARPIRIVVPYPAGGGSDIVARLVGAQLSTAMKQTVIIENHVGAGGSIGANLVAKAPPDGYTVLVDSMSGAINPVIATVPYDPVRDLLPVAQLVSQAFIVVANPKLPVKNLRDVARLAAERPNGLNAAVPGPATRLAAELFKLNTGAKITFIPYKGGAPATLSVMTGETDLGFIDVPSVAQNLIAGKLHGLAVTTAKRVSLIPDVPTSAEAGLPEYKVDSWLGIFVPAHTPTDIVNRLNKEINAALAAPHVADRIVKLGAEPSQSTAAEFGRLFRSDIERWKDVVVRAQVKIE